MMSTIPEQLAPYLSVEQMVFLPISTLFVMHLVYGIYIVLFGTYIYTICRRNQQDSDGERLNFQLYLTLTVILFTLSTVFVIICTIYYIHAAVVRVNTVQSGEYDLFTEYLNFGDFQRRLGYSTQVLVPTLLNVTAEWMLIHRCYRIWNSNRKVAMLLTIALVLVNGPALVRCILGWIGISAMARGSSNAENILLIGQTMDIVYAFASAINNLVITLLTAWRLQWVHRRIQDQDIHTSDKLVRAISRYILESGVIYPTVNVVVLVVEMTVPANSLVFGPAPLIPLCAGIVPTLIMVRAKLSNNDERLQDTVSEIRFARSPMLQTVSSPVQAHPIKSSGGTAEERDKTTVS